MFIFIDESGVSNIDCNQKYLVISLALMNNRAFALNLVNKIKDTYSDMKFKHTGELKYHDLNRLKREVATDTINRQYSNYHICLLDLESSSQRYMLDGKHENIIQKTMIKHTLQMIDPETFNTRDIKIIMDEKLPVPLQKIIRSEFISYLGKRKGVSVKSAKSNKEAGIQIADLIAGAFRADLKNKTHHLEANQSRIYNLKLHSLNIFETKKVNM
jgi:hypothetical protein